MADGVDFVAVGHLTAAAIGFAFVPFVRRVARRRAGPEGSPAAGD
ncbi:MAG: hypothetical protein U0V73_09550 [Acidimicrobiia bacterium]